MRTGGGVNVQVGGGGSFDAGVVAARRDGPSAEEIRRALAWRARNGGGWLAAARVIGCSEHALRLACDPTYQPVHAVGRPVTACRPAGSAGAGGRAAFTAAVLSLPPVAPAAPVAAPSPAGVGPRGGATGAKPRRARDPAAMRMLAVMVEQADRGETITVTSVGRALTMTKPGAQASLRKLFEAGFAAHGPRLRRRLMVWTVTDAGREALATFRRDGTPARVAWNDAPASLRRRAVLAVLAGRHDGLTTTQLRDLTPAPSGRPVSGGQMLSDMLALEADGLVTGQRGPRRTTAVIWQLTDKGRPIGEAAMRGDPHSDSETTAGRAAA